MGNCNFDPSYLNKWMVHYIVNLALNQPETLIFYYVKVLPCMILAMQNGKGKFRMKTFLFESEE